MQGNDRMRRHSLVGTSGLRLFTRGASLDRFIRSAQAAASEWMKQRSVAVLPHSGSRAATWHKGVQVKECSVRAA